MSEADAISLLYGGMEKLGPGSDEDTRHMLGELPPGPYALVVDAGCGSGRQTLVLAGELQTPIHAVDLFRPVVESACWAISTLIIILVIQRLRELISSLII